MARKFSVLEPDGSKGPQLKKSVALLLVRRQLAVLVAPFLIRKLSLSQQPPELPRHVLAGKSWQPRSYQHHVEPKINRFTIGNSEWLQYLHGYGTL